MRPRGEEKVRDPPEAPTNGSGLKAPPSECRDVTGWSSPGGHPRRSLLPPILRNGTLRKNPNVLAGLGWSEQTFAMKSKAPPGFINVDLDIVFQREAGCHRSICPPNSLFPLLRTDSQRHLPSPAGMQFGPRQCRHGDNQALCGHRGSGWQREATLGTGSEADIRRGI
jgi:hypothetical protein